MPERKYRICEGLYPNEVLAENMSFDMAIVFIRGFKDTYFNEHLSLILEEMSVTRDDSQ